MWVPVMKQIQTFTSTYTADVSGVPSALYELGGMSIMHDASGCNSTYNTHDEPRWYGSKSLVFISGLSEMEAIMGDDQKLVDDIVKAAKDLKPRFIAIAGTPIPMITGCDIAANARVIEAETGIPTFGIDTNGMHSYVEGAGEALFAYGKAFIKKDIAKSPSKKVRVNILGATPIDFSVNGQIESIEKFLEQNGFDVISNYALSCNIEKMANAALADVNLVISSVGIKIAEYLLAEFKIPYVIGVPYGKKLKEDIINSLNKAASGESDIIYASDLNEKLKNQGVYIIGESVTSKSLAKAIYYKHGITPIVISGVELGNTFHGDIIKSLKVRENVALEEKDLHIEDEDEIAVAIKGARVVIADPLYKPILSSKTKFAENPHEGFSGRLFRKRIINLVNKF